jgi:hypothetical protein
MTFLCAEPGMIRGRAAQSVDEYRAFLAASPAARRLVSTGRPWLLNGAPLPVISLQLLINGCASQLSGKTGFGAGGGETLPSSIRLPGAGRPRLLRPAPCPLMRLLTWAKRRPIRTAKDSAWPASTSWITAWSATSATEWAHCNLRSSYLDKMQRTFGTFEVG